MVRRTTSGYELHLNLDDDVPFVEHQLGGDVVCLEISQRLD